MMKLVLMQWGPVIQSRWGRATLCLDYNFAHSWHSLNQLHEECFSNNLEGVPTYAEHLLAAFPSLCGPTHPKPSQLG